MREKYKISFDVWGLILFLIIMIPNFIWFAVPAPNDILRAESATEIVDIIASVFQVVMVASLCFLISKDCKKPMKKRNLIEIIISILIYFIGWIFYYNGVTSPIIVLDLCIVPCLAFIFFSIGRKNRIALISAIIFLVCHFIYGIVNFIL
ncbi:hypothetical protein [Konateibacter massiliensis]|uniref:hypothetical protein n=1 Tax=Konateibacter massiliensis TaxID=2002841 RepID=UPI000C15CEA3|nr:hypothetical protein [Konateibacter massiliensis]